MTAESQEEKKMKKLQTYATLIEHKSGVKIQYTIICKLKNGNVIPAFAETFSEAMCIADTFSRGNFTERVKIIKTSTGATTRYVF